MAIMYVIDARSREMANVIEANELPEWYWTYGLHDAQILSFSELELPTDWKTKTPRYNCLEIMLDTEGARTQIRKIEFYNYSYKSDVNVKEIEKPWWMGDTLTHLPNGRFSLYVEIEDAKGKRYTFTITFDDARVE